MRLGWNRGEDGVITVYAHTSDGRVADIADFWLRPMMERFGADRSTALEYQEQFAEILVNARNRAFTLPLRDEKSAWKVQRLEDGAPCLLMANAIRDEINEILSRYDIPHDVHQQDVEIDAACVRLADKSRSVTMSR